MRESGEKLNRVLGRIDVIALAFGTMVGWAWVMLAGYWIAEAGVLGSMLSFGIGAVLCILVGFTYAELAAALPLAGGEMVYTYRGMGYICSWFSGWTITFAYLGVAAWEGIALATAVDYIFEIPYVGYIAEIAGYPVHASWAAVGSAAALVLMLLNYFGTRPAAIFQVMITAGLILVGLMFFFGGVSFGNPENALPLFTTKAGFITVLLMVPSMMIGFDVIPQSMEEMNIPLRSVSKILIFSIVLASLWYILIIISISLSAPSEVRNAGLVPAADAMAYAYDNYLFGNILIVGGICGILTSWNGFIMGATRIIFAMGRAKMLPPIFGKLHPKYKTPTAAILLTGFICIVAPVLGKNALVWFVNVSAFATVVSYLLVVLAFLILRKKEPELTRPYKIKAGFPVGIIAIGIAGFFIAMYLIPGFLSREPGLFSLLGSSQELIITFCWFIFGILLALYAKRTYPKVGVQEREFLIFGEDYARKEVRNES